MAGPLLSPHTPASHSTTRGWALATAEGGACREIPAGLDRSHAGRHGVLTPCALRPGSPSLPSRLERGTGRKGQRAACPPSRNQPWPARAGTGVSHVYGPRARPATRPAPVIVGGPTRAETCPGAARTAARPPAVDGQLHGHMGLEPRRPRDLRRGSRAATLPHDDSGALPAHALRLRRLGGRRHRCRVPLAWLANCCRGSTFYRVAGPRSVNRSHWKGPCRPPGGTKNSGVLLSVHWRHPTEFGAQSMASVGGGIKAPRPGVGNHLFAGRSCHTRRRNKPSLDMTKID